MFGHKASYVDWWSIKLKEMLQYLSTIFVTKLYLTQIITGSRYNDMLMSTKRVSAKRPLLK
jgi:hypothetical protein